MIFKQVNGQIPFTAIPLALSLFCSSSALCMQSERDPFAPKTSPTRSHSAPCLTSTPYELIEQVNTARGKIVNRTIIKRIYEANFPEILITPDLISKIIASEDVKALSDEEMFAIAKCYDLHSNHYLFKYNLIEEIKERSAKKNAAALNTLGWMYQQGVMISQDPTKAVESYKLAASCGNAAAQNNLGVAFRDGIGVEVDYKVAATWFGAAASLDFGDAQVNLAHAYRKGEGVEQSPESALTWLRKAARQGNARGQYNLGAAYLCGFGVPKNPKLSFSWYEKSALQGNPDAQNSMGYAYRFGLDVAKNDETAVMWYQKAADQGNTYAFNNLAWMYLYGRGVERNIEKAALLYDKAAKQGHPVALDNLGSIHQAGEGVTRDLKRAALLYYESIKKGNEAILAPQHLKSLFQQGASFDQSETHDSTTIAGLKDNLTNLKTHYYHHSGQAGGGFNTGPGNPYLKKLSEQILILCDSYEVLLAGLEKPGFLITCLDFNSEAFHSAKSVMDDQISLSDLIVIHNTKKYLSFTQTDVSPIKGNALYNHINELNHVYQTTMTAFKSITLLIGKAGNSLDLANTLVTIFLEGYKLADSEKGTFLCTFLDPYFKASDLESKKLFLNTSIESFQEVLHELPDHLEFAKAINQEITEYIEKTTGNRNNLFLKSIWNKQ